jgi:predicted DNA binding CopG/RHH family protein
MDVLTARVPIPLHEAVKRKCEREGDSISNYIRTLLVLNLHSNE